MKNSSWSFPSLQRAFILEMASLWFPLRAWNLPFVHLLGWLWFTSLLCRATSRFVSWWLCKTRVSSKLSYGKGDSSPMERKWIAGRKITSLLLSPRTSLKSTERSCFTQTNPNLPLLSLERWWQQGWKLEFFYSSSSTDQELWQDFFFLIMFVFFFFLLVLSLFTFFFKYNCSEA